MTGVKRKKRPALKLLPACTKEAKKETPMLSVPVPPGYREGDGVGLSRPFCSKLESHGIHAYDVTVAYRSPDVRSGELARIMVDGCAYDGIYHPAPGGYMRLETDLEEYIFRPDEGTLFGRIVGVVRDGIYIEPKCKLRPIRDLRTEGGRT